MYSRMVTHQGIASVLKIVKEIPKASLFFFEREGGGWEGERWGVYNISLRGRSFDVDFRLSLCKHFVLHVSFIISVQQKPATDKHRIIYPY